MRQGRRSKSGERRLGDDYVDALFAVYAGKVPAEADFVCYWFAKAWEAMQAGRAQRVGLVATNSIRGGAIGACSIPSRPRPKFRGVERRALDRRGRRRAGFGCSALAPDAQRRLDGREVAQINADLTSKAINLTTASRLRKMQTSRFKALQKALHSKLCVPSQWAG